MLPVTPLPVLAIVRLLRRLQAVLDSLGRKAFGGQTSRGADHCKGPIMPVSSTPDFILNSTTANDQGFPAITALADGRFVATWQTFDNGTDTDIRARIYNANGTAVGSDFIVNSTTTNDQSSPAITALADGRFVATWISNDNGTDGNIRARIYSANGTAVGDDFVVNSGPINALFNPALTTLADGRFVATWQSRDNGTDFDIQARIFNANGTAAGTDFIVNSTTTNDQSSPAIAALADGRFVATWHSNDNGTDTDIQARIYNANGTAAGRDFIVNSTTASDQVDSAITALADGRFVATWVSYDNGTDANIRARIYSANGTAADTDFIVNSTTTNDQTIPAVAALADGRFVVTWRSLDNGTDSDIRGRVYNANGTAAGSDFIVNSTTANYQHNPVITALADGHLAVTWFSDEAGDGSGSSIRGSIIDLDTFQGTSGEDSWSGGGNTDHLFGYDGDDTFNGNAGDDYINGGGGSDTLRGGTGNDRVHGGASNDFVYGDSGNDTLYGNDGTDLLNGGSGNDSLRGGADGDQLIGGSGTDTASYHLDFTGVKAALDGTYTAAQQTGAAHNDTYSSIENLSGSDTGADTLVGNLNGNSLKGNGGADKLFGRAGNDTLTGGAGIDKLTGGAGADKFVYAATGEGGDTVTDFAHGDHLVFEGSAFGLGSYAGVLQASHFVTRATGHAAKHAGDFVFDQSTDQLWFDSNGTTAGGVTMMADLNNIGLTNADILIV
jgi:Ca2+-binding RTX toxin-like protein